MLVEHVWQPPDASRKMNAPPWIIAHDNALASILSLGIAHRLMLPLLPIARYGIGRIITLNLRAAQGRGGGTPRHRAARASPWTLILWLCSLSCLCQIPQCDRKGVCGILAMHDRKHTLLL